VAPLVKGMFKKSQISRSRGKKEITLNDRRVGATALVRQLITHFQLIKKGKKLCLLLSGGLKGRGKYQDSGFRPQRLQKQQGAVGTHTFSICNSSEKEEGEGCAQGGPVDFLQEHGE